MDNSKLNLIIISREIIGELFRALVCHPLVDKSYRQIALQYGLNNPSLIARWKSDFMKYGTNAFVERPKGRIPTMSRTDEKAKITTHTKSRNQKKKKELTPEQARILELEKQLRYAQIENAYLKELRRLRLEGIPQNKKRESSIVSEDPSN